MWKIRKENNMLKIKRKEHNSVPIMDNEEDIVIKLLGFRFYFRDFFNFISLANDLLTGILYLVASILTLMGVPSVYSTVLYLLGAIFLTLRPLLKIFHNTFLSKIQPVQTRSKKANRESNNKK